MWRITTDNKRKIKFFSDTRYRKQWFTGLHFSHPAKMHFSLQLWLIENFTKEGETILDPMAGSGTVLVACSMGRNVICVELEDKFVQMQNDNWVKIQQRGCQLGYSMGTATILQGDARSLAGLLVDKCIFSPPYAEQIHPTGQTVEKVIATNNPKHLGKYSQPMIVDGYGGGLNTKPPRERHNDQTGRTMSLSQIGAGKYDKVDAVISSPPYEGQMESARHVGGIVGRENLRDKGGDMSLPVFYAEAKENIGNLKGDTYLSAMLQVYQQCYTVLKAGGLMVLVTKNFIRNKKQVRLDLNTIKLCEQVGFTFRERWYRELANQSFWRTIYHQKYPEVEPIKYEDILVFGKCKTVS